MSEEALKIIDNRRIEIDGLDEQIVKLLVKRFDSAKEISKQKKLLGKLDYDPDREKLIFDKISELCNNEGSEEICSYIVEIYSELLKQSKLYQASNKDGY